MSWTVDDKLWSPPRVRWMISVDYYHLVPGRGGTALFRSVSGRCESRREGGFGSRTYHVSVAPAANRGLEFEVSGASGRLFEPSGVGLLVNYRKRAGLGGGVFRPCPVCRGFGWVDPGRRDLRVSFGASMCSGGSRPIELVWTTPCREFIRRKRKRIRPLAGSAGLHPASSLLELVSIRSCCSTRQLIWGLVTGPASQHHGPDTNCGVNIQNPPQAVLKIGRVQTGLVVAWLRNGAPFAKPYPKRTAGAAALG